MAKKAETSAGAPPAGGTLKVRLLVSMGVCREDTGAVVSYQAGKELELPELTAKRHVWAGHAEPLGWDCPDAPAEETQEERCRQYNLKHGIVTPETMELLEAQSEDD